jgi:hypothetical protein
LIVHYLFYLINNPFLYYKLKSEKPEVLSTAVSSIIRSRAFFDDVRALAFTLHPIKQSIAVLESQSCTLADCFFGLAKLGTAIKKLPDNDYQTFHWQCISIFNRHYAKFADQIYLLCFFLHPSYIGKLLIIFKI